MRIISIGTDTKILDINSDVFKRQVINYQDFELASIFILNSGSKKEIKIGNLEVYCVGGNKISVFIKTFFSILKLQSKNKYDLIYTQDVLYAGIMGYLLKIILKLKLIIQLHGDYLDNDLWIKQRKENYLLNIIGKFVLRRADKVRCVSQRIVKFVLNFRSDVENVKSFPIGYNEEFFNLNNISLIPQKHIIFIGRLIEEKEPIWFLNSVISVLKKYNDFKVVIIGEGGLKEEMQTIIKSEGLENRFIFTGFISLLEISNILKESYMLVKTAKWEGWGMQLVEANACGMPVITTDSGCVGEVIFNDINGIVLKENSEQELTKGIEELISDEKYYTMLREEILREEKKFSFSKISKEISNFLQN